MFLETPSDLKPCLEPTFDRVGLVFAYETELRLLFWTLWIHYAILKKQPQQDQVAAIEFWDEKFAQALDYALSLEINKTRGRTESRTYIFKTQEHVSELRLRLQAICRQLDAAYMQELLDKYEYSIDDEDQCSIKPKSGNSSMVNELKTLLHGQGIYNWNPLFLLGFHINASIVLPENILAYLLRAVKHKYGSRSEELETISPDEFTPSNEVIGSGVFGVVRHCCWRRKNVAMKCPTAQADKAELVRELLLWQVASKHSSPYIITLLGIAEFEQQYCAIMPYYENGTASTYVRRKDVDLLDQMRLLLQIATGLHQMHHDLQLCHGDLKAVNVLIDDNGNAIIADFSSVRSCIGAQWLREVDPQPSGTIRWKSPARYLYDVPSKPDDIFAFGMTAWEIFTSKLPYYDISANLVMQATLDGIRPTQLPGSPIYPDVWNIMKRCWDTLPDEPVYTTARLLKDLQDFEGSLRLGLSFVGRPGHIGYR